MSYIASLPSDSFWPGRRATRNAAWGHRTGGFRKGGFRIYGVWYLEYPPKNVENLVDLARSRI